MATARSYSSRGDSGPTRRESVRRVSKEKDRDKINELLNKKVSIHRNVNYGARIAWIIVVIALVYVAYYGSPFG